MRTRWLKVLAAVGLTMALSACFELPEHQAVETVEVEFLELPPPPPAASDTLECQPDSPRAEDAPTEREPQQNIDRKSDGQASIQPAPMAEAGIPPDPDRSCQVDADCAVKNVGNCCGYFPACVNVQADTFPERVMAACEAQGLSSICGFQDITACACVEGRCEAAPGGGELR